MFLEDFEGPATSKGTKGTASLPDSIFGFLPLAAGAFPLFLGTPREDVLNLEVFLLYSNKNYNNFFLLVTLVSQRTFCLNNNPPSRWAPDETLAVGLSLKIQT